jgi:hypothetical protein
MNLFYIFIYNIIFKYRRELCKVLELYIILDNVIIELVDNIDINYSSVCLPILEDTAADLEEEVRSFVGLKYNYVLVCLL